MRFKLAVACGCFAIVAVNASGIAAEPIKPPLSVAPAVAVPPPQLESAFSDYRPFRDEKLRSWKEANQDVADHPGMGSMGGMKGMATTKPAARAAV